MQHRTCYNVSVRKEVLKMTVKNLPFHYEPFIVARPYDGDLWYWGSWESEETAHTIAIEVDGIVVYAEDLDP